MLYEVGSRPGLIGILRKGYLRRERLSREGRRTVLDLIRPGGVVGEMPGRVAGYSLEAATDVQICLFSPPLARRLATADPEFRLGLSADIETQFDTELIFGWLRGSLRCRERVIAFLVMAADFLPSEPEPDGSVLVTVPVGRQDWADLCNTTVESISRQIAELSSERLVENLGGKVYRIRNLQALRNMLGPDDTAFVQSSQVPMTAINASRRVAVPNVAARAPLAEAVVRG